MLELIVTYESCTVIFTLKEEDLNRPVMESLWYAGLFLRYPN